MVMSALVLALEPTPDLHSLDPLTSLDSALTACYLILSTKRLCKSFRIRSYKPFARNPFRIRSCKKERGVGGRPPLSTILSVSQRRQCGTGKIGTKEVRRNTP